MPKQLDAKNLEEEGKKILKEQAKKETDEEKEKTELQKRWDHDPSIPRHRWIHYHKKQPKPKEEEPPPEP